jgi:hypothetical protein
MSISKPTETVREAMGTNFNVVIPQHIHEQVMFWVNKSTKEVSWFGTVDFDKDIQQFKVKKVYLLKQEVSGATTDICEDALAQLMYQVHKEDPMAELRWWGHSHVNMSVFWSGEDKNTIRQLGYNGWILASVFNKKREVRSAFCTKVDILGNDHEVFVDDIATDIEWSTNETLEQAWSKEYEEKVQEKSYGYVSPVTGMPSYNGGYSWQGHGRGMNWDPPTAGGPGKKGKSPGKKPTPQEIQVAGYPLKGLGSIGYNERGKSPLAWSGQYDSNGKQLYPDDRDTAERQNPEGHWVNGFLSGGVYWVYGHYFGETVFMTEAFSQIPNPATKPEDVMPDHTMEELADMRDGQKFYILEDEVPSQMFLDESPGNVTYEEDDDYVETVNDWVGMGNTSSIKRDGTEWTKEEIDFAKSCYGAKTDDEALEALNYFEPHMSGHYPA